MSYIVSVWAVPDAASGAGGGGCQCVVKSGAAQPLLQRAACSKPVSSLQVWLEYRSMIVGLQFVGVLLSWKPGLL